ncbi:MAG TPA: hypothetical protein VGM90_32390 [Kofleriaceae bacterium]|jgi:hypothetical protein
MYRDDADAARLRLASVQAELRVVSAEIAELEALRGPCTSKEHAAQVAKLATLDEVIAAARAKHETRSLFPELEAQLTALKGRHVDLELLDGGSAAMQAKLAEHERAIAALDHANARDSVVALSAPSAASDGEWVWMPQRSTGRTLARWWTTAGLAASAISIAIGIAGAALPPAAFGVALMLTFLGAGSHGGRMLRERETLRAQINPAMLHGRPWSAAKGIRITRRHLQEWLVVYFDDGEVSFSSTQDNYRHVVEVARTAAAMHGLHVDGEFPRQLPAAGET